ncbi:hypothetical protein ASG43_19610 [Aureimonas sp. Leaf454]|uniref:tellurite resistance TerB family protein n=1 Tax=Aureimonas sp. Leaf454 TaxID=1736381 RepID=UPI0006F52E35|nr:TerB family tellurite resistance protein [Aureimonas sp. Leaf454]KQT52667.1 hypothetical protein ASG43_19610 [Aureimonas sp. Leaf454]
MFEGFKDFLRSIGVEDAFGATAPATADDPRVAAAALLFHVGEADGAITAAELDRLKTALAEEFGLGDAEAERIAAAGRDADHEAVDLYRFTSVLKSRLDEAARIRFVEILWDVTYADGTVHELEDNTIWRVADLLGVSTRDRMLGKHQAARRSERAQ